MERTRVVLIKLKGVCTTSGCIPFHYPNKKVTLSLFLFECVVGEETFERSGKAGGETVQVCECNLPKLTAGNNWSVSTSCGK